MIWRHHIEGATPQRAARRATSWAAGAESGTLMRERPVAEVAMGHLPIVGPRRGPVDHPAPARVVATGSRTPRTRVAAQPTAPVTTSPRRGRHAPRNSPPLVA